MHGGNRGIIHVTLAIPVIQKRDCLLSLNDLLNNCIAPTQRPIIIAKPDTFAELFPFINTPIVDSKTFTR